MLDTKPITNLDYPDIIYFIYSLDSESVSKTFHKNDLKLNFLDSFKLSSCTYVNAILQDYFLKTHRPRSFDFSASCSNSFHDHEKISLPEIHLYTNLNIKIDSDKVFIHDIKPVLKICPIDILKTKYIPALKAALILYHSQNSDNNRNFFLSDVDITFHSFNNSLDKAAIYLAGLEYQPLFSFLCFHRGLKVFENENNKKLSDIELYESYAKELKLSIQTILFNNGIIHIPHMHAKLFYDLYYHYLNDLNKTGLENLKYPSPFWTAEMFATNYAIQEMGLKNNVIFRRFDPDVMGITHDINQQYSLYIKSILGLENITG